MDDVRDDALEQVARLCSRLVDQASRSSAQLLEDLERMEQQLVLLQGDAVRERADVDRLERVHVRMWAWLRGTLEAQETKERREYDAAIARVLEAGQRTEALREAVHELRLVTDEEVARSFARVARASLLPPALAPVWERADRHRRLVLMGRLCETAIRRGNFRGAHVVEHLRASVLDLQLLSLHGLVSSVGWWEVPDLVRVLETSLQTEREAVLAGLASDTQQLLLSGLDSVGPPGAE